MTDETSLTKDTDKGWRRHFKLHMLSLEHENPSRFVHGPWRRRNRVEPIFLIYRLLIASVMIGTLFWTGSTFWNGGKWFIYLTHWGFLAVTLETLLGAVLVAIAFKRQASLADESCSSTGNDSMPLSYKIFWCIYNIALPNAFFITIMYWSLLYNPETETRLGVPTPLNVMIHAINSVVAFLELILAGPPSRFLHVLHPLGFGIVYMIFNIIYWAAGGTDPKGQPWVYEVLKWENAGPTTILMLLSAVLLIILHLIVTIIAGLRSRLSKSCKKLLAKTQSTAPIWTTQHSISTGNFNKSFVTDIP